MNYSLEQAKQIYADAKSKGLNPNKVMAEIVNRGGVIEGINMEQARNFSNQNVDTPKQTSSFGDRLRDTTQGGVIGRDPEKLADIQETGANIKESFLETGAKIQEAKEASKAGEQSGVRGALQGVGMSAGFAAEAAALGTMGVLKSLASQSTEDKVQQKAFELIEKAKDTPGGEDFQELSAGFKNFYDNELTDVQRRDVDGILGATELGLEFIGVGKGKKAVRSAEELVSEGIETVADKAKKLIPDDNVVVTVPKPSQLDNLSKKSSFAKDMVNDIKSQNSAAEWRDRFIARSLKLAPKQDISDFKLKTGNELGEFMGRNDLIKGTPEETVLSLTDFKNNNYQTVRDAVALVPGRYPINEVPGVEAMIDNMIKDLKPQQAQKFKDQLAYLENIKATGDVDLSQIQNIKALGDDLNSYYTRQGVVREGLTDQNGALLSSEVREFIENSVKEVYGDKIPIKKLNNNVQSSQFIVDAIAKRSSKGDTQSLASIGDYAVLGIGQQAAPGIGLVALMGKKFVEMSPVQLRMAQFMAGKADDTVLDSITPKELKEINKLIGEELEAEIKDPSNI